MSKRIHAETTESDFPISQPGPCSNHCSQSREKPATLEFRNNGEKNTDERDLNEEGLKRQQVRICYYLPYCQKK